MKILLLNDNPVVRKLVALSAQKTKDDLSVIWSVDEVEGSEYDLLIVDDAHYSDEAMSALKEKIQYKTSLLMATRGNATPAGFDKVINKPFLPTDLVDLFSQIAKDLTSPVQEAVEARIPDAKKAIVLDDTLEDDVEEEGFDITNLDDDLNLDDFDIEDEEDTEETKMNVLDHEEVQELQGLLDDTDNFDIEDELSFDDLLDDEKEAIAETAVDDEMNDEDLLASLDDDVLQALEAKSPEGSPENELDDTMDEFDFDEELLGLDEEPAKPAQESLDDEDLLGSLDDLMGIDESEGDVVSEELAPIEEALDEDLLGSLDDLLAMDEEEVTPAPQAAEVAEEIDDLDALLLEGLEGLDEDEEIGSGEAADDALSDDEFGELEQQIQEAVEELGVEDLEKGLDEVDMGDLEDFGDLDGLSERDIKLAIGEEVEEEPEVHVGQGSHSSLHTESLEEALIGEPSMVELDDELEDINIDMPTALASTQEHHGTPSEGMDALQALLKALSNEEVSKTLKGLSINININFGNEK
jgi:uncharacterized membrane protein